MEDSIDEKAISGATICVDELAKALFIAQSKGSSYSDQCNALMTVLVVEMSKAKMGKEQFIWYLGDCYDLLNGAK